MLTTKLRALHLDISEYNFANLYLFRKVHQYKVPVTTDPHFIKGISREGLPFIMPLIPLSDWKQEDLIASLATVHCFFPIPNQWTPHLSPEIFQKSYNEGDSDYLFLREKISTFTGHKISKKRNLVKQLLEAHQVQTFPLTPDRLEDALHILENWQYEQNSPIETDYEPCREALMLMETLGLSGDITYVDHKPNAFSIGEQWPPHQYVIHFVKAKREIKGLYQYLYQTVAQSLDPAITFMNWEQDLGLPSLRQSKYSYQPDHLVLKWCVQLKNPQGGS